MVSYSIIWKIEMSHLKVFKFFFFFWTVRKQNKECDSLTVDKLEDHQIMI